MDTFIDFISAVQSDLNAGADSTLFDTPTAQQAINRAKNKIEDMHLWPELKDSQVASTKANREYYDYPQKWRAESIWKLRIGGIDYGDPIAFRDYEEEKDNQFPSQLKYMWASEGRRFFVYPTPTVDGQNDIEIWGYKTGDKLVNNSDTTVFSYSMPSVNEAIVLEAVAILKAKGGEEPVMLRSMIKGALLLSIEANGIVELAWQKVRQQQGRTQKTQPFFDVPDFFPDRRRVIRNKIGDF